MNEKYFVFMLIMAVAFFALMLSQLANKILLFGRKQANNVVLVATAILIALNQFVPTTNYSTMHIVATIILYLCVYPLWRYLFFQEKSIPFVPILLLIYGIYFAVPAFFPFDPFIPFRSVSPEARLQGLFLSLGGVFSLLFAFYKLPISMWSFWTPRLRPVGWSASLAARLAVVLGVSGVIANGVINFFPIPTALAAALFFVSQLSLLSISILLYLQLQRQLPVSFKWMLWMCIVPAQLLVDVSTGFMYPLIRESCMILMVYLFVKKSVPWAQIIPAMAFTIILLFSKSEFRRIVWTEGSGGPLESASVYVQVVQDTVFASNSEELDKSLGELINRIDNGTLLAHVMQQTPQSVPYWGGETYLGIFWRFVPRVIWSDKPVGEMGQAFGHRYNILTANDTNTSWNLPQMVEMFANFGVVGVIVGMGLLGCLYSFLRYGLEHSQSSEWGKLSNIVIYTSLLQVDGNFVLVFGNLLYWIVLLHLIGRFVFVTNAHKPHATSIGSRTVNIVRQGPK